MPIANQRVCDAIRDGKMARQPCEECGKQNTHAHHDDYAKPLDVRWLCPRHHGALHAEMRRQTGVLRRSPPPRMVGSGRSSSKAL